ncbi:glycosyltransferase family 9 protein [Desulfoluna sp.]|uniref:glycosyltransferase family 9 protein n=1 Tax=Desulfoluna sp. TaxID=2045199 RepID=UPI00262540F0|nr:glycosyltransferase family 9 protein [Desulfoluna sp.]
MNKILVIRNDKIGDFMLAWPSFAMLKTSLPDCRVVALVPRYTAALARLCPWIDDVIIDPTKKADKSEQKKVIEEIRGHRFDASINLFSTSYNALVVWRAGIPYRLAPATKLAQIFYTRRITQRRSRSLKPEYQYNLDLIRSFLAEREQPIIEVQAPYLTMPADQLSAQRQKLAKQLSINDEKPWVYVHAGSGGSANNLSLEQYAALIVGMDVHCEVVLTAGPGEEANARRLQSMVESKGRHVALYDRNEGLIDFTCAIACADLFIAGSTGPLHIAGALDVPTVGFFPRRRSATPLRWLPLNSEGRHLSFCPPEGGGAQGETDMSRIDVEVVLSVITPWASQYLS